MVDSIRNPFVRYPIATIGVMVLAGILSLAFSTVKVDSEMDDLLSSDQQNQEISSIF